MSLTLLYLVSEWVVRLAMLPVVAHRRRLISALAWLAVIFFQPWIGAILFFLTERWAEGRIRKHAELVAETRIVDRVAFRDPDGDALPSGSLGAGLATLGRTLGAFSVTGGNRVRVIGDRDEAFEELLRDIRQARNHVHLVFYIFRDDDTGRRVARELADAAERGVRCRVLADSVGSQAFFGDLAPWLGERGVEVEEAFPIRLLGGLGPPDVRNHRKLVIVDGRVAYAGSLNVGDAEGWGGPEPEPWRDLTVRIEGPAARQLQLVFVEDWAASEGEDLSTEGLFPRPVAAGREVIQVVPSGPAAMPRKRIFRDMLVSAFHGARERIVVTTPYLIPDEVTEAALFLAVGRGVQVDIVVPERSDSRFVTAASRAHYADLLEAGVRVWEHRRGFLHAKAVTVDQALALLGSANFDRRSFDLSFELTVLLYGPDSVEDVVRTQEGYLCESKELDVGRWRRRPLPRRLVEDVAKLASPLL